jgi:acyl dehydratase
VYAQASQFVGVAATAFQSAMYAHGLMWARALVSQCETAIALGISEWKFIEPIFIGDTIFVNYDCRVSRESRSGPRKRLPP